MEKVPRLCLTSIADAPAPSCSSQDPRSCLWALPILGGPLSQQAHLCVQDGFLHPHSPRQMPEFYPFTAQRKEKKRKKAGKTACTLLTQAGAPHREARETPATSLSSRLSSAPTSLNKELCMLNPSYRNVYASRNVTREMCLVT